MGPPGPGFGMPPHGMFGDFPPDGNPDGPPPEFWGGGGGGGERTFEKKVVSCVKRVTLQRRLRGHLTCLIRVDALLSGTLAY
jgi:hypothetical protein